MHISNLYTILMLKYSQPTVSSPIFLIIIFCSIYAGESQIPSSSNQQPLQVQIEDSPSLYENICQTTFSVISKNFTTENPEGFETFAISILDSKSNVSFLTNVSSPYIHTQKEVIKSSAEICKRGEFNSSFYCFSIQSSNKSSARLKYNDTHFMYKFTLTNIQCPNESEIGESGYDAQFRIEVPNNRTSKEIKSSYVLKYRFAKNDLLLINCCFIITSLLVMSILAGAMYNCRNTLTTAEKWVYFLLILTEPAIKVILIVGLKFVLPQRLIEIPLNSYLLWIFIVLPVIKLFLFNIPVAISFVINIKKEESEITMTPFIFAMLFDYKLYFLFIFEFYPLCELSDSRNFWCEKNVKRYTGLLLVEGVFILIQIISIVICSSLLVKIMFFVWLAAFSAIIAVVMKTTKLKIENVNEGGLAQDKERHGQKQQPMPLQQEGEVPKDEKQQQISDLANRKMQQEEEIRSDRPISIGSVAIEDYKNVGY